MRLDIQVTGVADVIKELNNFSGALLAKAAQTGLKKGMQRVAVPAIRAEAPESAGIAPWERRKSAAKAMGASKAVKNAAKRGGPLRKKITVRVARKRAGEMAAVRAGPNTYYAGWVIKGTKPHTIRARGGSERASSAQVRVMNRQPDSVRALVFNGIFRTQVHHPGARPNPFVGRAASRHGLQEALASAINDELRKKR